MLSEKEITFYKRQLSLKQFGLDEQEKLKNAKILIVGAGGLACPALLYLCGAGIGKIGLIDGDEVSVHNLHRQTLYDYHSIGKKKTEIAKQKLNALNPFVEIEIHSVFLDVGNALDLIEKYDLIIDCTDNFETRYLINDSCILLDKPFVYGSVYRFEGQVGVFNFNSGPTYRCLFPETDENKNVLNCNDDGVLGVLPGLIGIYQAVEAVKIITGIGEILSGKLLILNILNNTSTIISVDRKTLDYKECLLKKGLSKKKYTCHLSPDKQLEDADIEKMDNFIFLDVRNFEELPRIKSEMVLEIPLTELENRISELPLDKNIICLCQSGKRSARAYEMLSTILDEKQVFNLKNGLSNEFERIWKKQ